MHFIVGLTTKKKPRLYIANIIVEITLMLLDPYQCQLPFYRFPRSE